ncbi:MAG: bifunctional methylenetetrahydrofolate dehydrogenase/methenyltetrahydrofolate cyclohydrolase FolD [Pseudomonadota bacterium]|nr:bifunctional methylenetetrahydrofolate dehydrogenase/methenyltetrahydrofolate cyclohydrolase FolD [Pseudomonadota bacterium]MEC9392380.1 bifunctional methylenetetrahydrofolate dehydrogenase/methenyltetrahydrofolate cyclohydrolase FolD [Pseudomonadota bacterium]MEC9459533.1 bifunctional methylenetetrahydrofolate dehydrogenase/methenyltetrahydrofolate cyclohydrolase FolD [Pseudomonadota bacterium]MED5436609.1 bifunctional methylenetetrahydrofolate dehydrogenase/methenyltetrahydrofolate cyclohyd|tara:strand:+ start:2381 stop:3280 length:900 start_codon:yes stop_codon:yes gene_type:complete
MPANIIDGKEFASRLRVKISESVSDLKDSHNIIPGLAVVLVGNDPASEIYVRNKGIQTKEAGMNSYEFKMSEDTSEEELLSKVEELNNNSDVNGILVQFPVPNHISQQKVIETISPKKDVDGLHPINSGYLNSGLDGLVPCTPKGASILIKSSADKLEGKNAVIIGRSNLVGKPVAQLLLKEHCTVTICHSKSKDLQDIAASADILVAAVGIPELVKGDWIKPGATVIDVGINRIDAPEKGENKTRLVGDVDFEAASKVAGHITPVPGGVGPMTIACLLLNTLNAFCEQNGFEKPSINI